MDIDLLRSSTNNNNNNNNNSNNNNNFNYLNSNEKNKKLSSLPTETLLDIFSYIRRRKRDIQSLACVCWRWNDLIGAYILHKQVVVSGPHHCLSITTDGECYVWGDNSFGQLGIGVQRSYHPRHLTHLNTIQISMMATGSSHSLALTNNGKIYSWGRNISGQLGLGTTQGIPTPTLVPWPTSREVAAIACGVSHSLALCMDGRCYSWGFNEYGQLGLGPGASNFVTSPTLIAGLSDKTVFHITAAFAHNLVNTLQDESYSWGLNGYGQLGIGNTTGQHSPVLINGLANKKVRSFCGGVAHSLALTHDAKCYAWGRNDYGQLGLGPTVALSLEPTLITGLDHLDVTQLASGWNHCFALAGHGDCYSWGLNIFGQLGHGNKNNYAEPTKIQGLAGKGVMVVAGGMGHSLALSSEGECFSWGLNSTGQLGAQGKNQVLVPVPIGWSVYHTLPAAHEKLPRKRTVP
eukprot:TRINITY_DN664_c0_g1_i2.p1 TRINITY_DN664_c0_g1~~TRINITY_DN664_c0_g1_i2.p1  ORF type:complete len:462 (-),score=52.71 TRINITY_DN664_c0_g1_i2:38-1423(-)